MIVKFYPNIVHDPFIFTGKTATSLIGLDLVTYSVHIVQLNFNYAYKRWLATNGYHSVAFFSVERAAEQQKSKISLVQREESLYECPSSAVAQELDWVLVMTFVDGR